MKPRNPNIVRSRFKLFTALFCGILLLGCSVLFAHFLISGPVGGWNRDNTWVIALAVFMLVMLLSVLSLIRYVVIDRERGRLVYWSLPRPWGRRFDLADFTGKLATTESNRYDYGFGVAHLVDGRHIRRVIYGTFYRNFDEMYDAIPLPEVKNGLRIGEYLLLATVGRIRVPKRWTKKTKRKPTVKKSPPKQNNPYLRPCIKYENHKLKISTDMNNELDYYLIDNDNNPNYPVLEYKDVDEGDIFFEKGPMNN